MGIGGYPIVGFEFLPGSGGYVQTYDIQTSPGNPYTGVQFWAMGGSSPITVEVEMPDASTNSGIQNPTCTTACGAYCRAPVTISGGWTLYQVPFSSMFGTVTGGNQNTTVDTTTATGVEWLETTPGPFTLLLDDISFY
jgi:hypothetical protein